MTGRRPLPFFIDYPDNGNREGRLAALYARVKHTSDLTWRTLA